MRLVEARRLTGPNLWLDGPGAIAEVAFSSDEDPAAALTRWRERLGQHLAEAGWSDATVASRRHAEGATVGFAAPIDRLYAAVELLERTADVREPTEDDLGGPLPDVLANEAKPRLLELRDAAWSRHLPFWWDDERVTIGSGRFGRTWTVEALPAPEDVPWDEVRTIPTALITGTNGKTTSTRLSARILARAGLLPGNTSSDGIAVNEHFVDRGDWTGPGGAREVVRRSDVEAALLEVARGGILRRGLPVDRCDVALITNVDSDHLGEYGIDDVDDMARVKAVVAKAADRLVLNADDPSLTRIAASLDTPVIWFSLDPDNPVLDPNGESWVLEDDVLVHRQDGRSEKVISVRDVPITFAGHARHNVANALGAAALTTVLGVSREALVAGLSSFGTGADDNPGRGNLFDVDGHRILLDFGHNPAGVAAVMRLARGLRGAGRLRVSIGQAGDRSDEDLEGLITSIHGADPTEILIRDMPGYERGRETGEVVGILHRTALQHGLSEEAVVLVDSESHAVTHALDRGQAGDLCVVLVHVEREEVAALLEARSARRVG